MTQKFTILNQKQRNYLEVRPLCIMWETSIIFVCVCVGMGQIKVSAGQEV